MSNDNFNPVAARAAISEILKIPNTAEQQYTNVVTQVYPLRARMQQLETFCNAYLNLGEDPKNVTGRPFFKPAAPWVLMQVCNYGKMATSNFGWFSQHELAFGIPIESYTIDRNGRAVFQDWALVYPFIYVDNPLSMSGGRQIYGWPKSAINIDKVEPNFEPNTPHCIISISRPTGSTVSPASPEYKQNSEKFLEIYQQRPFLSGRSGVENALMAIPRTIAGSLAGAFGVLETMGLPGSGYLNRDTRSLQEALQRVFDYTRRFMPTVYGGQGRSRFDAETNGGLSSVGIITLKQFRDAEKPAEACYQAIVRSRMSINRMIDGGLLFDPLSGDSTGGIQINLLRTPSQAIVNELGIESSEQTSLEGQAADVLRPVIPFWSKVDVGYGAIDYQYWRTAKSGWSDRAPAPEPAAPAAGGKPAAPHSGAAPTVDAAWAWAAEAKLAAALAGDAAPVSKIDYGVKGSGAGLELEGPFQFNDVNIRVFPLLADTKKLQGLIDHYLQNDHYRFTVVDSGKKDTAQNGMSYVCVLIINFKSALMQLKKGADGEAKEHPGDRMVRFVVPGKIQDKQDTDAKNGKLAMVPILTLAGEDWNYITEYEVYGRFALKSILDSPQSTWMDHPPTDDKRVGATPKNALATNGLLNVQTVLIPEFNKDKPAQLLMAIKIDSQGIPTATKGAVGQHLDRTGLSRYATGAGFYCIAMKQVRDAKLSNEPAYKSLVGVWTKFKAADASTQGTLSAAELKIYKYPGLPIVDLLGLKNGKLSDKGDYTSFEPVDPFYVGGTMQDHPAENLTTMINGNWIPPARNWLERYTKSPTWYEMRLTVAAGAERTR